MAKKKQTKTNGSKRVGLVWNFNDGKRRAFIPVLQKNEDLDLNHVIKPSASVKIVQVVEYANLSYMFGGFKRLLEYAGLKFEDLVAGEVILFLNTERNYIKLVVGNGTPDPIIAAYRFPKGVRLASQATKEVVRAFLKRGELQMDERLRAAVGETIPEARKRMNQLNS